jgi:hypothetical protein
LPDSAFGDTDDAYKNLRFIMRYRTTLWMAFVFLVLIAYLFIIEFPLQQKKLEKELQAKNIFNINKEEIDFIKIKYPNQEIHLKKVAEDYWDIIHPLATGADNREIASLISTIVDMKLNRMLDVQNLSDHGLDQPAIEIILTLGEQEEKVIIGNDGAVANTLYVQRGSDQQVLLVDQWIRGALTRTVFDLRNKSILSIDQDKVTELELIFPKDYFLMTKEQNQWWIKEPESVRADSSIINNLLLALSNLRATNFVDNEDEKMRTQNEFKTADLIATIKDNDINPKISFYRAIEKEPVFAVTTQDLPFYMISDSVLSDFKTDLFYYQDKIMLNFEKTQIKRIDIKTASESYSLQLTSGTWSLDGEETEINTEEVNRFLDRMKTLKAQKKPHFPVQPKLVGLDPPSTEIRLFNAPGEMAAQLVIGSEVDTTLHAMGITELGTVLINKDVLDDIPRKNELIKSQKSDDKPVSNAPGP